MADEKAPPEFMSALVTEHFVLQSTASSTISESGSRVSIYLSALSSGLVAIGFASSTSHALAALAFTMLPTVFILGFGGIVLLVLSLRYEHRRLTPVVLSSPAGRRGDETELT
jgi:hypothetical protein